jgi:hypothetical protein
MHPHELPRRASHASHHQTHWGATLSVGRITITRLPGQPWRSNHSAPPRSHPGTHGTSPILLGAGSAANSSGSNQAFVRVPARFPRHFFLPKSPNMLPRNRFDNIALSRKWLETGIRECDIPMDGPSLLGAFRIDRQNPPSYRMASLAWPAARPAAFRARLAARASTLHRSHRAGWRKRAARPVRSPASSRSGSTPHSFSSASLALSWPAHSCHDARKPGCNVNAEKPLRKTGAMLAISTPVESYRDLPGPIGTAGDDNPSICGFESPRLTTTGVVTYTRHHER